MGLSESGCEKCQNVMLEGFCVDNYSISKDGLDKLAYNHVPVGGEELVPASDDEALEVKHLLAETKYENPLDNNIIYMDPVDTEKYLMLEDFPCSDEFCSVNADFAISNTEATQNQEQLVDSILQDRDEDQSLHVTENLSSGCPDYLLESGFVEKIPYMDSDLHRDYGLGNSSLEYLQTLEMDSDTDEKPDLTNINPRTDNPSDQNALYLGNMSINELQNGSRSTYGQGSHIVDKQQLKQHFLFGLSSLVDLYDTSNNLTNRLLLDENEDMIFLSTDDLSETSYGYLTTTNTFNQKNLVGKLLNERHTDKDSATANISDGGRLRLLDLEDREHAPAIKKRMRKPTRRYIEESSELKSRSCAEKFESPNVSPQEKNLQVRTQDSQWERSGSTQLICSETSSTLSGSQVTYVVQPRRGRPRKNFTNAVKDLKSKKGHIHNAVQQKTVYGSVSYNSENEDDALDSCPGPPTRSNKYGTRRKHHRLWTLTEVTKLIDGVSRYGVGRWTDIKRLLFSSSAYRTSVDLKDKWRNLLRASGAYVRGRKEAGARKKHLSGLVPQSVLRRVRDLAILHPYPRERKTGVPLLAAAPASGKECAKDAPCSKRTVPKRSSGAFGV